VACEQVLQAYAAVYGFELAMLRFAGVYGYGHYAGGSGMGIGMYTLVRNALATGRAELSSRMSEDDELVYVKDLARGVAQAVHASALAHQVYNLGSGVLTGPETIAQTLQRILPGVQVRRAASPRGASHPRLQPFDLSRARAELGYEPHYDLEAGLIDFIEEIKRFTS
jgi:nucleoside-diphosphate-sugar epimerase